MNLDRPARYAIRQLTGRVRSSRLVRNVLHDLGSTAEFGDLYEHEKMLADGVRVDAYAEAIARHVSAGDTVLDLGTGTGILALLAARQRPARIYAVDHSPFLGIAERIAARNGGEAITFVRSNSRDFTPPEPVDVVIHEQLGDDLFDENMLENLLDLKRRVLRPGGRIVPGRFELYVEPVALDPANRVPHLWEIDVQGLDLRFLEGDPELAAYASRRHRTHYLQPGAVSHFLGEPEPALVVDLAEISSVDEVPTGFAATRRVVRAGDLDGLCVHFRVVFDERTSFSTSPLEPRTHWGNRLFRTPARRCAPGDVVSYRVDMPDLTRAETWVVRVDG